MVFVKFLLILIQVVSGILLIGIILLQKSKDEGLGLAFGASMGESLFGSRAGNVLTKITIGLAIVFMLNTVLLAVVSSHARRGSLIDQAAEGPAPMPAPAAGPAMPGTPPPAAVPDGAPSTPAGEATRPTIPPPVSQDQQSLEKPR